MLLLLALLACPAPPAAPPPTAIPAVSSGPAISPSAEAAATSARSRLEAKGFTVTIGQASSGPLGWTPDTAGVSLTVVDPTQTVAWSAPYSRDAATQVHPSVVLVFLPSTPRLTTRFSMVTREQPATVVGAVAGVFVLTPQFKNRDDGSFARTVDAVVFEGTTGAPPGVLRVVKDQAAPLELPQNVAAGIYAFEWDFTEGADATSVLIDAPLDP